MVVAALRNSVTPLTSQSPQQPPHARVRKAGSVLSGSTRGQKGYQNYCRGQSCVTAAGMGESILEGMRKLMGNESAKEEEEVLTSLFFSDNAPSWTNLAEILEQQKASLGVEDHDLETGPPSPLALKRTFGSKEPIRVKLYRDHAAWCPYCQKVWMQLEEKKIPYEIEKINMRCYGDKKPSFLRIAPSGLLPVMEFKGQVIIESARIAEILEAEFQENPLLPPENSAERKRAKRLMRLERECFPVWCQWLCTNWGTMANEAAFVNAMRSVDDELDVTAGPYFLEDFSLVDIIFAPFLERMDASITYFKGFRMRGQGQFPNIERWFEAMETRPSYIATRSDYFTHAHALPPQLGGCNMTDKGRPVAEKIDGQEWKLPLAPLNSNSFEPYSPGENPALDTFEAARQLVENHEAVVKFAARGCGEDRQPVMAELSNPNATPNEECIPQVDAALRHVAHALLIGVEEKQKLDSESLGTVEKASSGYTDGAPPYIAMAYMRNRIGVPRDFKLPAARQLRAHLTWMMESIIA